MWIKSFLMALLLIPVDCLVDAKTIRIRNSIGLQEQFKDANATYLIKESIDLLGKTVVIPANSILKFKNKSIVSNGTIQGNNTLISGNPAFSGVRLKGSFKTSVFYASWCMPSFMSDYCEDVMNLSNNTVLIVDRDIFLSDKRRNVTHLNLQGNSSKNNTVYNSDRFYVTYGGCWISDLNFKWTKERVRDPKDNYSAVVIYSDLLQKDTVVSVKIRNIVADGGAYCSFFMKQYKSSISPKLKTINDVENALFCGFTRGAIWTCGGTGKVVNCTFSSIGYEGSQALHSVFPLRLGYNNNGEEGTKAIGYVVRDCLFDSIVAAYSLQNDGRELHGLLAYGDQFSVKNNTFKTLSTCFTKAIDPGMDAEMLYIKGSFNIVENNLFVNGAGSKSDGVVTLKAGTTEGSVIRNNRFLTTNNSSNFIYLGGVNHTIEGNTFTSTYAFDNENPSYVIFLGYREQNEGKESVVVRNNSFSFTGKSNYIVTYANKWGDITLEHNQVVNVPQLLKCNKRNGKVIIRNNRVQVDNVQRNNNSSVISVLEDNGLTVVVEENEFVITSSVIGLIVSGSNYRFNRNLVILNDSSLQSLLRGSNTLIEVENNTFSIDAESSLLRGAIVGEKKSSNVKYSGNHFTKRSISHFLSK